MRRHGVAAERARHEGEQLSATLPGSVRRLAHVIALTTGSLLAARQGTQPWHGRGRRRALWRRSGCGQGGELTCQRAQRLIIGSRSAGSKFLLITSAPWTQRSKDWQGTVILELRFAVALDLCMLHHMNTIDTRIATTIMAIYIYIPASSAGRFFCATGIPRTKVARSQIFRPRRFFSPEGLTLCSRNTIAQRHVKSGFRFFPPA